MKHMIKILKAIHSSSSPSSSPSPFIFTLLLLLALPAAAETPTPVVDPSSTYSPTKIVNGSFDARPFEAYKYNNTVYNSWPGDVFTGNLWQEVYPNGVDKGWNSTETKIYNGGLFEYSSNPKTYGLSSSNGAFIEMNAFNSAVFFQDLTTHGGDVIRWGLSHGCRSGTGEQIIRAEIGAPNGTATGVGNNVDSKIVASTLAKYTYTGVENPAGVTYGYAGALANLRVTATGWHSVNGIYVIPENQSVTRFAFIAVLPTNGAGNLLDDLTFSTLIGNLKAKSIGDAGVDVFGYWGDTDTTKTLKVVAGSTTNDLVMSGVCGKNFKVRLPTSVIGSATEVEIFHQDYPAAKRTVKIEPHKHCICGVSGSVPHCTEVHDQAEIEWKAWTSTTSLPNEAGNWFLTDDVTLSATYTAVNGVNLCLNGHVVKGNGSASAIKVASGAFRVTDCSETPHHYTVGSDYQWILNDSSSAGAIAYDALAARPEPGAVIALPGGAITGGRASEGSWHDAYGGGVLITCGDFTLYRGNIVGNNATGLYVGGANCKAFGSGVGVDSGSGGQGGKFTMNGGRVTGNLVTGAHTLNGGAVAGNCVMNGGDVAFNTSATGFGGGVYTKTFTPEDATVPFAHARPFTMTGGSIRYNWSKREGGGAYVGNVTTIGGSATICGNISDGKPNNLYLVDGNTVAVSTTTPLTADAKIGVTTETKPTTTAVPVTGQNAGNLKNFFTSDDAAYDIVNIDNVVCLGTYAQVTNDGTTPTAAKFETGFTFTLGINASGAGTAVFVDNGQTVNGNTRGITAGTDYYIKWPNGFKYYDGTTYDIYFKITPRNTASSWGWQFTYESAFVTMPGSGSVNKDFYMEAWLQKDGAPVTDVDLIGGSCYMANSEGARPFSDNGKIYTNIPNPETVWRWYAGDLIWKESTNGYNAPNYYILGHGTTSEGHLKGGYTGGSGCGAEFVFGYITKNVTFKAENEDGTPSSAAFAYTANPSVWNASTKTLKVAADHQIGTLPTVTLAHQHVKCWYLGTDKTKTYTTEEAAKVYVPSNIMMTAVMATDKYTLTFMNRATSTDETLGGQPFYNTPTNVVYVYGGSVAQTPAVTKPNAKFLGWTTSSTGVVPEYTNDQLATLDLENGGNKFLYSVYGVELGIPAFVALDECSTLPDDGRVYTFEIKKLDSYTPMPATNRLELAVPTARGEENCVGYGPDDLDNPWRMTYTAGDYYYHVSQVTNAAHAGETLDQGRWEIQLTVDPDATPRYKISSAIYYGKVADLDENSFHIVKANNNVAAKVTVEGSKTKVALGGNQVVSGDAFNTAVMKGKFAIDFTRNFRVVGSFTPPKAATPDGTCVGFMPNTQTLYQSDLIGGGNLGYIGNTKFAKSLVLDFDPYNNGSTYGDPGYNHFTLTETKDNGYPNYLTAQHKNVSSCWPTDASQYSIVNDTTDNKLYFKVTLPNGTVLDYAYTNPTNLFKSKTAYFFMSGVVRYGSAGSWGLGSVGSTAPSLTMYFDSFNYLGQRDGYGSVTNIFVNRQEAFVKYNAWGGAFADGEETVSEFAEDAKSFFPLVNPTRNGYDFVDWFVSWTNGAAQATDGLLDPIADREVYAKWISKSSPEPEDPSDPKSNDGTIEFEPVATNADGSAVIGAGALINRATNVLQTTDFALPEFTSNGPNGIPYVIVKDHAFAYANYDGLRVEESIAAAKAAGKKRPTVEEQHTNCLSSVTISTYVTNIQSYAFAECEVLTNVTFSQTRDYLTGEKTKLVIGDWAFANSAVKSVVFPADTCVELDVGAFADAPNLEDIYILGDVSVKGKYPFAGAGRDLYHRTGRTAKVHLSAKLAASPEYVLALTNGMSAVTVKLLDEIVGTIDVKKLLPGESSVTFVFTVDTDSSWLKVSKDTLYCFWATTPDGVTVGTGNVKKPTTLTGPNASGEYTATVNTDGAPGACFFKLAIGDQW